jgi:hypothetical protein
MRLGSWRRRRGSINAGGWRADCELGPVLRSVLDIGGVVWRRYLYLYLYKHSMYAPFE